jgi:hypothetical protein
LIFGRGREVIRRPFLPMEWPIWGVFLHSVATERLRYSPTMSTKNGWEGYGSRGWRPARDARFDKSNLVAARPIHIPNPLRL